MLTSSREHVLNPYLEGALARLGRDGLVLDLGCGRGFWMERMAERGLVPVGIEPETERAAEAGRHGPVAVAEGAALPFGAATVGAVWCIHVLHHLDDPERVLSEIRRVLRPGGHLLLAETVEDHPGIRLARRVHPEWDGVPVRSRFRAGALLDLLATSGFEVVEHRQHSLVSFAAWTLPVGGQRAWLALNRLEGWLPSGLDRWGAHLECVARAG